MRMINHQLWKTRKEKWALRWMPMWMLQSRISPELGDAASVPALIHYLRIIQLLPGLPPGFTLEWGSEESTKRATLTRRGSPLPTNLLVGGFFLLDGHWLFKRCRLRFSLSPDRHLGTEHRLCGKEELRLDDPEGGGGGGGVAAHSSSGAEIWEAAWLTSLMWILPSHKTSKLAECVIILAANQASICEWNHITTSHRNNASSRLWALLML